MGVKRIVCVLLAAAAMTCVLTGCGDKETDSKDTGASAAQTAETVDVAAQADELKSGITFEDELVEFDAGKIERILGISEDKYTSAKCYVSSSGGTPEEIDCFQAADDTAANDIKTALEARVEAQKKTFTDYRPEQAPKLSDPVLKVKGTCVYLVVSGDNAKAEEIIG